MKVARRNSDSFQTLSAMLHSQQPPAVFLVYQCGLLLQRLQRVNRFVPAMYTPFSAGKTFGNQETKIILCAFSHSIYSSPIHNLFAVSFGMKSQKRPMQLSYLLFCSIAEQSMRLQSFAPCILPIPIQPFPSNPFLDTSLD